MEDIKCHITYFKDLIELRDFISKGNNDNNSTELFHEAKKISFEPFKNEKTESNTNTKIFLNKKRNHEKISYENKNHILIKENLIRGNSNELSAV